MNSSNLEDDLSDIVGKAARGMGGWMAKGNCIDLAKEGVRFGLSKTALTKMLQQPYPQVDLTGKPISRLELPFEQFTVNTWLIGPKDDAILIDTGFEPCASTLLATLGTTIPKAVLLTHDDRDHWGGAKTLQKTFPRSVLFYGPEGESPEPFQALAPQQQKQISNWQIEAISVPGHTPYSVTWKLEHPDLDGPVLACGDSLFAGSIGKIRGDYHQGLEAVETKLLTLPPQWLVLPGHGPATTIATEKQYNPFFAD